MMISMFNKVANSEIIDGVDRKTTTDSITHNTPFKLTP